MREFHGQIFTGKVIRFRSEDGRGFGYILPDIPDWFEVLFRDRYHKKVVLGAQGPEFTEVKTKAPREPKYNDSVVFQWHNSPSKNRGPSAWSWCFDFEWKTLEEAFSQQAPQVAH